MSTTSLPCWHRQREGLHGTCSRCAYDVTLLAQTGLGPSPSLYKSPYDPQDAASMEQYAKSNRPQVQGDCDAFETVAQTQLCQSWKAWDDSRTFVDGLMGIPVRQSAPYIYPTTIDSDADTLLEQPPALPTQHRSVPYRAVMSQGCASQRSTSGSSAQPAGNKGLFAPATARSPAVAADDQQLHSPSCRNTSQLQGSTDHSRIIFDAGNGMSLPHGQQASRERYADRHHVARLGERREHSSEGEESEDEDEQSGDDDQE